MPATDPRIEIVGDDEPSDEAIAALARLLLADVAHGETERAPRPDSEVA